MNVTATLIGQMLTFAVLVWFVNRYLWGPMTQMLEDRKTRIADGLAAAERGKHEQELAQQRAADLLSEAKQQAAEIVAQAQKRASLIIDEAKEQAHGEGEKIIAAAEAEVAQEIHRAREQLRGQVVTLAIAGAGKVLQHEIDASNHERLLDDLVAQL